MFKWRLEVTHHDKYSCLLVSVFSLIYFVHFSNSLQPTSALLGECYQEPPVCVWHPQEQHQWCLFVCGSPDLHGLLFHLRTPPWERLTIEQAALCQGHPQLQKLGGEVSSPHGGVCTPVTGWMKRENTTLAMFQANKHSMTSTDLWAVKPHPNYNTARMDGCAQGWERLYWEWKGWDGGEK